MEYRWAESEAHLLCSFSDGHHYSSLHPSVACLLRQYLLYSDPSAHFTSAFNPSSCYLPISPSPLSEKLQTAAVLWPRWGLTLLICSRNLKISWIYSRLSRGSNSTLLLVSACVHEWWGHECRACVSSVQGLIDSKVALAAFSLIDVEVSTVICRRLLVWLSSTITTCSASGLHSLAQHTVSATYVQTKNVILVPSVEHNLTKHKQIDKMQAKKNLYHFINTYNKSHLENNAPAAVRANLGGN